ncbi:uncharacterized protein AB675_5610 [Cyphellophora attinorum]|uniref:Phytocyanin domain-containing protein n=1 Tax=Cyphellophora attinorum TaxID=1664694 RepID=A0A0N1H6T7_9EURO|nr:uncharacterized protein AB675_5610 [Phialophora attinorum]KPI41884.1 hypothetical protein AB675_5610 [Phialophora attinorum]
MSTISAILFLTIPLFTNAQDYGGSPAPKSSSASAAAASSAPAAGVHVVDVGKTGFNFMPSSLTAKVGDQVEFHFDNPTHSVAQSVFNSPCAPSGPTGFWSGFPNDLSKPFTITINSTDPIWFYCAQVSHCQSGMVGVINPPSGQTIDDFTSAAKNAPNSKAPTTIQGGVFAAASGAKTSGSASASASGTGSAATSSASSVSGVERLSVDVMAALGAGGLMLAWMS